MKLAKLRSGGLIPTYCCSSACGHCLYNCHPRRDHAYMDRETADKCFSAVKALGCRTMHIGGGEPFLNPEGLYAVLESARETGMYIEYVETNSSWFTSSERTLSILDELKKRGINTLLLSISPFHNEYIPFRKVEGLMAACDKSGIHIFPWTMEMLPDVQSMDPEVKHPLSDYIKLYGDSYVVEAIGRYGVIPGGKALQTLQPYVDKQPLEKILSMRSPCERLTGTTHFHVDLYGNYVPCMCPGLSIRLEDAGSELTAVNYPLLTSLITSGVAGLYELAVREHGFEADRQGYFAPCELCHDIRRYLAIDKDIGSHELQPTEFYE